MKCLLLIVIMTRCSRSYHYPHITEEDALAIFSSYAILKDHPPISQVFLSVSSQKLELINLRSNTRRKRLKIKQRETFYKIETLSKISGTESRELVVAE